MNLDATYAVVDIETTGTNYKNDDRIIQFSCCLVVNNQIQQVFSSDVNPHQEITSRIQQLTGIDDQRLQQAPDFDQLAGKLYGLLSNTIFVAHNVNFDFPFLNAEFERAGYPPLANEAIDTVTMSQILMPTLSSYRLKDLSDHFKITHLNPHSADSDAIATGHLLIKLLAKLRSLPNKTLSQIVTLQPQLPLDTFKVFAQVNRINKQQPTVKKLTADLKLVAGLIIKRISITPQQVVPKDGYHYPKTKISKNKVLPLAYESRTEQNKMMNLIYNNYADQSKRLAKPLLIEAPTGLGKSYGYCLPFSYLAHPDKPVIISTSTNYLQNQLDDKTLPSLNERLPFTINSVVLKGASHYIDIDKFSRLLNVRDNSSQTAFVKAQILVWLTMTTTGDLDELHLNVEQTPFIEKIRHWGIKWLSKTSDLYNDDYLRLNLKRAQAADFIIVNHSYLLDHYQQLADYPERPYLVIDETQQFVETINKKNQEQVKLFPISNGINKLLVQLNGNYPGTFQQIDFDNGTITAINNSLVAILKETGKLLERINRDFYRWFVKKEFAKETSQFCEIPIKEERLNRFKKSYHQQISTLARNGDLINEIIEQFNKQLKINASAYAASDYLIINAFLNLLSQVIEQINSFKRVFRTEAVAYQESIYWLTTNSSFDINTMVIHKGNVFFHSGLNQRIYSFFEPITFTGATIFTTKKSQFIFNSLGIDKNSTVIRRLKSDFDPEQQARIFIPNDLDVGAPNNTEAYINQLAQSIQTVCEHRLGQTLVLFNSLETIKQVYHQLSINGFTANHEVLAQDVNGSANKISKQFIHREPAVLLGANVFWQGVDFPNHLLETIVIAQLPFETPEDPYNQAVYRIYQRNGFNPFFNLVVPKVTLKLRQGMGRLLRTTADKGTIFVLDNRLISKTYGDIVLNNLKNGIPVVNDTLANCLKQDGEFLGQSKKR